MSLRVMRAHTKAHFCFLDAELYITTDRLYFDIDLYKAGTNEKVGGYRGYADGVTGGSYFIVTNGGRYYIKFTPYGLIYNNEYPYGSGLVTPVTYP